MLVEVVVKISIMDKRIRLLLEEEGVVVAFLRF
jgi:hypothetical protein